MKEIINYIEKLTSIPSPTGFTHDIINYVKNEVESMGYEALLTNKNGLLVTVEGKDNSQQRMTTAHLDTLGAMVRDIKDNGRLKLELVGGFTFNAIENENCLIHTGEGKTINGTILMRQASVHTYSDARTAERNKENMEVRLDEKVTSKEDTKKLGIEVGDFVSFDPRTLVTDNGFIKSRHLDDKVSAAILLYLLKEYKDKGVELEHTTHFYFSNNEEIGYGANSNIPKEVVDYLAVDMGALGDGQQSDEYTVSICAKDSSGPYNYTIRKQLVALAKDNDLDYRVDIYPHYGSDASAALSAGSDVRHGLVGAGIESSHSYERTHIDSIQNTVKLVDLFLKSKIER